MTDAHSEESMTSREYCISIGREHTWRALKDFIFIRKLKIIIELMTNI
jgi:hypothetical protein